MRVITFLIHIVLIFSLSSCSYDLSRRVVQQGNLLPQAKINKLAIGMSKNDAAMLMGTSLISPMFNDNRWNYAYTWRKGSNSLLVRHVILYFAHDRLVRIEHS